MARTPASPADLLIRFSARHGGLLTWNQSAIERVIGVQFDGQRVLSHVELAAAPEVGQLVRVRDRHWVVSDVVASTLRDGRARPAPRRARLGRGRRLRRRAERHLGDRARHGRYSTTATLPRPQLDRFDDPDRLDAFLDAVRWGAIASADSRALQAPFRSRHHDRGLPARPGRARAADAAREPADRRRRRARQDDRGRARRPGAAAAPPRPHGAGRLPGELVREVAGRDARPVRARVPDRRRRRRAASSAAPAASAANLVRRTSRG